MSEKSYTETVRLHIFDGEDRDHYLHIGYFIAWYSSVELGITGLLAMATNSQNLDAFELLVYGMDAKTKVERLRKASKTGVTLGQNLSDRLTFFYDKIIPIRNSLVHSGLTQDPQKTALHFSSLAKLPFYAIGQPQRGAKPTRMPYRKLFEYALWLNFFSDDLIKIINAVPPKIIEIDHPRSPKPPDSKQDQRPSKTPATPGRRERKRARKGQPLRGTKEPD
jgi:hypothetical protein